MTQDLLIIKQMTNEMWYSI